VERGDDGGVLVSAAAAVLVLVPSVGQRSLRMLTPGEMREDLFQLTEKLTSLHGGLHRYASEAEIQGAFDTAFLAVEERERDQLWFYRQACELVAHVHCGHTNVRLPENVQLAALDRRGVLPIQVRLQGERLWITRVLEARAGLEPGKEILTIDGLDVATIRARALARSSGDGFVETGKERALEAGFAEAFALLVGEREAGPYEVLLAGAAAPLFVEPITGSRYSVLRRFPARNPVVEFELRAGDGVAILDFDAFADPPGGGPRFLDQLEEGFRRLREEKVPHLILDLRGNGGGRDMYGATLVSYLSSKPFGYFERITVTPDYAGEGRIEEKDGLRRMLSHDGLQVQQPADDRFRGNVCILIDGGTFSTAADVATVAHANHLATFFGEETGGGYEGNNSGSTEFLRLSNSGLAVSVPHWNYRTAGIGSGHEGRGVVPDYPVCNSIEDELAGRDAVLERALEYLRSRPTR
jgi:hypothetical protein